MENTNHGKPEKNKKDKTIFKKKKRKEKIKWIKIDTKKWKHEWNSTSNIYRDKQ